MARMKILDLIALVKRLMPLLPLLTLPNWLDSEAVRQWAIKVLAVLDDWAKLTATEVDDTLVDFGSRLPPTLKRGTRSIRCFMILLPMKLAAPRATTGLPLWPIKSALILLPSS